MNLLTINSYNCSAQAMGGVNQTTVTLTTYFTQHFGIRCFLGFFEDLPATYEPLPLFEGRIRLSRALDKKAFADFLQENNIEIVQVNFLKRENLKTIPLIASIAHLYGAKVIYAFHMCPGFQILAYGSFRRVWYGWKHKDNALDETKKWLMTATGRLWKGFARRTMQSKYRIPYDSCDKVVVLSQYYCQTYLYYAGLAKGEKMTAIGNALRFNEFATEQDIAHKQKTVLVVARFDEDTKRISLMLEAWKAIERDTRLDEWILQLVGDGRDRAFYEYLVRLWGLQRVEFKGRQNPKEFYRNASVFLMTSTAEGWAMVLTEAAQMGVPTVAMDSFGSLHVIIENNVNGRIVPNNDTHALAEAMKQMMINDGMRQQMARNAIERSKDFVIDKVAAQWKQLFDQLMPQNQ